MFPIMTIQFITCPPQQHQPLGSLRSPPPPIDWLYFNCTTASTFKTHVELSFGPTKDEESEVTLIPWLDIRYSQVELQLVLNIMCNGSNNINKHRISRSSVTCRDKRPKETEPTEEERNPRRAAAAVVGCPAFNQRLLVIGQPRVVIQC